MVNENEAFEDLKKKKLLLGILFDAMGMVTYTIPWVGEFGDVIWAPLAGVLMTRMYAGRVGRVAGVLTFVEEILPFTDIIPSFTLTWVYTYWVKRNKSDKEKKMDRLF